MNKLAKLFKKIDNFSIEATFNYQMVKLAAPNQELLNKYDDFDINDEKLFNQVEDFINQYKKFLNSLTIDANNLDPDKDDAPGELLKLLETKLERIVRNQYLNIEDGSDWDEGFDPGDLLQFVIDLYQDAENKLKEFANQDFELSEMMANQLAQDLNDQRVDKGDKNITWTGDKVQQSIESRQNRAKERALDMKSNPAKYQAYIDARRIQYKEWFNKIKNDPEKLSLHREGLRQRQEKFNKKLEVKREDLIRRLQKETHPFTVNKLENELHEVEVQIQNNKDNKRQTWKEIWEKDIKPVKESGTFSGNLLELDGNIRNVKMGIKKTITDKVKANIIASEFDKFKPYLDKIAAAKDANNKEGIKEFSKELNNALNMKAINDEAELHPKVVSFVNGANEFNELKRLLKDIDGSKVMESRDQLPDLVKERLKEIVVNATNLIKKYQGTPSFKVLINTTLKLIDQLNNRTV